MSEFQPGDIVERVLGDGLVKGDHIKVHGRYVVSSVGNLDITLKDCIGAWVANRFILIARGAGVELSQFINKGSQ